MKLEMEVKLKDDLIELKKRLEKEITEVEKATEDEILRFVFFTILVIFEGEK